MICSGQIHHCCLACISFWRFPKVIVLGCACGSCASAKVLSPAPSNLALAVSHASPKGRTMVKISIGSRGILLQDNEFRRVYADCELFRQCHFMHATLLTCVPLHAIGARSLDLGLRKAMRSPHQYHLIQTAHPSHQ